MSKYHPSIPGHLITKQKYGLKYKNVCAFAFHVLKFSFCYFKEWNRQTQREKTMVTGNRQDGKREMFSLERSS